MNEKAIVVEKQYSPEMSSVGFNTTVNSNGTIGTGMHTLEEDEKYIVIFKCAHGKVFAINKSEVYGKVDKGDTVSIEYYEIVNGDGEVKDYDFIDANKL